ncbi:MAG TPA: UDP-N-acetylmuramoyl-L-alanyl-D-glutamate--2,6-diaminopimelate ligase [Bacillota bacterium]|nr:UDP-N-acetylmuramoyl-L-alanyl-D-glutamate--2,6-diaminopimelate ligase [Bacillota bacterium]
MLFRELLGAVEVDAVNCETDIIVNGITYDSRRVKPGCLFVAVKGFKHDGHDYIEDAVERGASAVVAERKVTVPAGVAWAVVPDSRRALALLSARFFGYPSLKMRMIGVTGTNGKTTTASLLTAVLKAAGEKTGLIGTVHNLIGDKVLPVSHTTPESADLQELLHDMAAAGVGSCVMEVSSHALALHRVEGCEFDVAVFTNLTQDHLDFHSGMEDYLESKLRLFSSLGGFNRKKGGKYAVINADDAYAGRFSQAAGGNVCTYGLKGPADVLAEDISVTPGGVMFGVTGKWGRCFLNLKITGMFNVYNALAAFTAAAAIGVPLETIRKGLENSPGVAGRFELVDAGQDFSVIVDYAHTPDGLENVLRTARQITEKRLITVFGCGGDRDRAKRPLMGEIAVKYSDYSVITSDNPRTEDPLKIINDIEQGVKTGSERASYTVEPDRRKAIRLAVKTAGRGDVVVIAGKGHEDYQIIGTVKYPFDDRLEAKAAIEEKNKAIYSE